MDLTPKLPPGRANRKALAFATEITRLRAAGYTRISPGMQSAAPHVLKVLDRVHSAGRAPAAALEARGIKFDSHLHSLPNLVRQELATRKSPQGPSHP